MLLWTKEPFLCEDFIRVLSLYGNMSSNKSKGSKKLLVIWCFNVKGAPIQTIMTVYPITLFPLWALQLGQIVQLWQCFPSISFYETTEVSLMYKTHGTHPSQVAYFSVRCVKIWEKVKDFRKALHFIQRNTEMEMYIFLNQGKHVQ